jgi:beta-galactosidase
LTRRFSSDPAHDRFQIQADDAALAGDGSDATRLVFAKVDKFGAPRALGDGEVSFKIRGPGSIVGDNPFALTDAGGMGAVWIKAASGGAGTIHVIAKHSTLGAKSLKIKVTPSEFA